MINAKITWAEQFAGAVAKRPVALSPATLLALALAALLLASCGDSAASRPAAESTQTQRRVLKATIVDAPLALGSGRKTATFVEDSLFEFEDLPGGNLGDFVADNGTKYQRFAITHREERGAIVTLATLVRHMSETQALHGYEGFRGAFAGQDAWIFRRGKVVAGVLGLPDAEAKVELARMAYSLR